MQGVPASDWNVDDDVVWWAFFPRDDAGVFIPYDPWPVFKARELPLEDEIAKVGRKATRMVALFGEPGLVEGYLTTDADFYVPVPVDVLRDYFERTTGGA
jgi:hypothetical protein